MVGTDLWAATLYGVLSGAAGTGAGGLLAGLLPGKAKRLFGFVLEYAAGLMLAIVCFELLPQSLQYLSLQAVLPGLGLGVAAMAASEGILSRNGPKPASGISNTGMAIALGIALHNFLEGMAVGSGFCGEPALGVSLAAAVLLHDVPEGMSIAVPLRADGVGRVRAFLWTLAAGLPMGLGCLFGAWAGGQAPALIGACLSVAGGAMIYIVFVDMIPESKRLDSGNLGAAGSILGLVTGIAVSVGLGA